MALCLLHDPPLEIADSHDGRWMFKHLTDAHGLGNPDRWPDGQPVVIDLGLTLDDYRAEADR